MAATIFNYIYLYKHRSLQSSSFPLLRRKKQDRHFFLFVNKSSQERNTIILWWVTWKCSHIGNYICTKSILNESSSILSVRLWLRVSTTPESNEGLLKCTSFVVDKKLFFPLLGYPLPLSVLVDSQCSSLWQMQLDIR